MWRSCWRRAHVAVQKRMNLTKTISKAPITLDLERVGAATDGTVHKPVPKYDHQGAFPAVSGEGREGGRG